MLLLSGWQFKHFLAKRAREEKMDMLRKSEG
jgi:hypothetical protein